MISFRQITREDIPLMHDWFNEPHVQEFYSLHPWTEKEVLDKLLPTIEHKKPLFGYVVLVSDIPVGYLQYCRIKDFPWPQQGFDASVVETGAGLDFFIGDPHQTGKGLGPKIIESFLDAYIWPRFRFCVVDPDVKNLPSAKMFEKCRFVKHKTLHSTDALGNPITFTLMIRSREL